MRTLGRVPIQFTIRLRHHLLNSRSHLWIEIPCRSYLPGVVPVSHNYQKLGICRLSKISGMKLAAVALLTEIALSMSTKRAAPAIHFRALSI